MAAGCPVRWFCSIRQREDTTGSGALTSSRRVCPPADLLDLCSVWVLYSARRRVAQAARTHFSNCGTIFRFNIAREIRIRLPGAREINHTHCIKSRILNPLRDVPCTRYIIYISLYIIASNYETMSVIIQLVLSRRIYKSFILRTSTDCFP